MAFEWRLGASIYPIYSSMQMLVFLVVFQRIISQNNGALVLHEKSSAATCCRLYISRNLLIGTDNP